ncbi:cation diffusion facilitator family transporter [Fundicoccus ignavus]|uniref:Cation diffusion facilitator family transporter n=1 Tax=Fundicoccus ignavus TaxID=2664442 RepID=A0A6I2GGU1_9LACT|nr:cation diffusion facilitator family transporter [Fundicoccus ignavus]MRI85052.1 cation diffusion facilitator family transporter [Fundicoccus ignavus]MRJ46330.1 cation diffusion facilitator family transporter [Fundicoccus ignavus]
MFNKFINQMTNANNKEERRQRVGILSGRVGLVSNLFLFVIKLIAGLMSGSISIVTDAMNNLGDSASSVITLFGFRAASKPADKEHPFGHERSEYISGLIISIIIIYVGLQFLSSSFNQIMHPTPLNTSALVFVLLIVSIVIKVLQGQFYRKMAKEIQSNTLQNSAQDSINDVYITTMVLVSSLVETWTGWQIDGYAGGLLSLFIIYSGIQAIRDSIDDLLGKRPSKVEIRQMKDLLDQYDNIVGYHDLLVHSYGPNQTFATIHIEIDDSWNLTRAHHLIDCIEEDFKHKLGVELVCHLDPIAIQNEHDTAIYRQVKAILKDFNLKFHDFKVEHQTILFDIVLPDNPQLTDDALFMQIEQKIHEQIGNYEVKIIFDRLDLLKEV